MTSSPATVQYLVLGLLSIAWLLTNRSTQRLDASRPYHVAAYQRDRRKARFYFLSVWIGLSAAFLAFLFQQALSGFQFDTTLARESAMSLARGLGLWGLLIIAAVWSQVGQRASQPNSDGASLTPLPEEKDPPRNRRERR